MTFIILEHFALILPLVFHRFSLIKLSTLGLWVEALLSSMFLSSPEVSQSLRRFYFCLLKKEAIIVVQQLEI